MPLTANPETGETTFLPPVIRPIHHRRKLQAGLDTLTLEGEEALSPEGQEMIAILGKLSGLESGKGPE
jgi:hypothetical protein